MRELEMREERRGENKKKNIVIRGGQWKEGEGEEVEAFIRKNLKVEAEVKESWKIRMKSGGEEIVVARLGKWEDKKEVMRTY